MDVITTSAPVPLDSFPNTAMDARRIFHSYLAQAKYETIRMLRAPAFSIPFLALPFLLYLLFAVVLFGDAARTDANTARFLFTAFAVFGVIGPAMFGFGVTIAMEREQGLLKFKRAVPTPPAAYLLAKMWMAAVFALLISATLIAAAVALGHLPLTAIQAFETTIINILGVLPFCAIGLYLGTLVSGRSAPGFVHLVYQPMLYLSGLFFPLPKSLQFAAPIWPAFYLQQLVFRAIGAPSRGPAILHIAVLTGVTVLFTTLATRRLACVG